MASSSRSIDLHYVDMGAGQPVLLLHGLGSRSSDWQLQMPVLAESYRVIAPDLRGHGASPKPSGPYTVAMMAADVSAMLQKLGLASAHLIGLSMGGMIAFQLAVAQPELVRSMVIVNSGPDLVPRTFRQRLQVMQRLSLAQLTRPKQSGKFLSQRLFPKPDQEQLRERFVVEWAQNDKQAYLASMKALIGWSVLDQVSDIQCPVLVISGDRDYTTVDAKQAYTNLIPGARLITIKDSGHASPIDQADRFNQIVLDFLSHASNEKVAQAAAIKPEREIEL